MLPAPALPPHTDRQNDFSIATGIYAGLGAAACAGAGGGRVRLCLAVARFADIRRGL